jgi:predicted adenylyl cyclase CyaB
MTTEIKAKIKDLEKVENSLKNIGAQFISEVEVTDIYFNSKEKTNLKIGIYPERTLPRSGSFLLFYEHDPVSKKFEFRQIKIDDADTLKYILDKILGTKIVINKIRKFYKLGAITISIDKIKELGNFLILQNEDREELLKILHKLGVDRSCLETKSFDMLMLEK